MNHVSWISFYFFNHIAMYDALKMHKETKQFEAYLLIHNRITNECKNGIKDALLQNLDQAYQKWDDLMTVLQSMPNN